MAKDKEKRAEDYIPLPDPEVVEEKVYALIDHAKRHQRLYLAAALVFLAAVVGILVWVNLAPAKEPTDFYALWQKAVPVQSNLARNLAADAQIQGLEQYVSGMKDQKLKGMGLWLCAVYRYADAWLPQHLSFEDRRPDLEKALQHLQTLASKSEYDDLLLAKSGWFEPQAPVDSLLARVKKDLAWAKEHSHAIPEPSKQPVVVLRTNLGDIYLNLFEKLAPKHVQNFIKLVKQGTYNDTAFFRIDGGKDNPQGILSGDPYTFFYPDPKRKADILTWGEGSAGYLIPPEKARFDVPHQRGIVTVVREERADWDNAVQFEILLSDDPSLDHGYTPFAKVVEGMSVLDRIATRKTAGESDAYKDDPGFKSLPNRDLLVEPVWIRKAIVYKDGTVEDGHRFPIAEGERKLSSLSSTPVSPLPAKEVDAGRRMRKIDAEGPIRHGLDFPYPSSVDVKKADPMGDRAAPKKETGKAGEGKTAGSGKTPENGTEKKKPAKEEKGGAEKPSEPKSSGSK